jgi:ABC-2 type transport system permease protein
VPDTVSEARVVFTEEFRRTVRRVSYVLVTLAVPAILVSVFVGVVAVRAFVEREEDDEPKLTGVVNLSADLRLPTGNFSGMVALSTREQGTEALLDGSVSELYVIPIDYLRIGSLEWLTASEGAFAAFDPGPGGESRARITNLLRLALAEQELPRDILARAMVPATFERTRIGDDGQPVTDEDDFNFAPLLLSFGGSFMLLFAISMGGSSLVQSVAEEKETRMIEVLLTSAKPMSIMAGKVLAIGLAGLIQMTVWLGAFVIVVPLIFDIFPDGPAFDIDPILVIWVVFFFVGGYFISGVLLSGLGAISTGVKEANQLSMMVILPLASPFWFVTAVVGNPEGAMATGLSLFPLTAPITMLIRIAISEPPVVQIVASGLILVGSGVVLLWLSARVFRAALLLYGQRMSFGQVWTALRQSGA